MGRFLYYAVRQGAAPGVYDSWKECEPLVRCHNFAVYKGFNCLADVERFVRGESVRDVSRILSQSLHSCIVLMDSSMHAISDFLFLVVQAGDGSPEGRSVGGGSPSPAVGTSAVISPLKCFPAPPEVRG